MTENRQHEPSPWAAPGAGGTTSGSDIVIPPTPRAAATPATPATPGPVSTWQPKPTGSGSGSQQTSDSLDSADLSSADLSSADPAPPMDNRRLLTRFVAAAGALVAMAIVIAVVLAATGVWRPFDGPIGPLAVNPAPDTRPPLARSCPPPTDTQDPSLPPAPPTPAGPRTNDSEAGISYRAYGDPWTIWQENWRGGTLGVHYRIGQHFVTETYAGGTYHASILSGSVPAAVNDGTALDLKCAGQAVTADVRAEYYPQPNRIQMIRNEATTLGGRPAWVSVFRLHFNEPGLAVDNELVAVATINVGRPEAAILYVSIPGSHKQWDWVVNDVLRSTRSP